MKQYERKEYLQIIPLTLVCSGYLLLGMGPALSVVSTPNDNLLKEKEYCLCKQKSIGENFLARDGSSLPSHLLFIVLLWVCPILIISLQSLSALHRTTTSFLSPRSMSSFTTIFICLLLLVFNPPNPIRAEYKHMSMG